MQYSAELLLYNSISNINFVDSQNMIRFYEYPSIFTVIYFLIYIQAIAQTKIKVGDFLSKDERHSVHGTLFKQAGDEETLEIQGFEYNDSSCPDVVFMVGSDNSAPSFEHGLELQQTYSKDGKNNKILKVPNNLSKVSELRWLSLWCKSLNADLGSVIFLSNALPNDKEEMLSNSDTTADTDPVQEEKVEKEMQSSNELQEEEATLVPDSSQDVLSTPVEEAANDRTQENRQTDSEIASTIESIMKTVDQAIFMFNTLAGVGWVAGWYFLYQNVESFCKWSLKF